MPDLYFKVSPNCVTVAGPSDQLQVDSVCLPFFETVRMRFKNLFYARPQQYYFSSITI
jgi:hypothetical protein